MHPHEELLAFVAEKVAEARRQLAELEKRRDDDVQGAWSSELRGICELIGRGRARGRQWLELEELLLEWIQRPPPAPSYELPKADPPK